MKQIGLIAVLAAIFAVSAYASESSIYLQMVDQSTFGHKLLDIIQVQLNTATDPVGTILDLLAKMRAELESEQKQGGEVHRSFRSNCKKIEPELKTRIQKLQSRIGTIQNTIDSKKSTLGDLKKQLKENKVVVDAAKTAVKTMEGQAKDNRAKLEKEIEEFGKLRAALIKAKEILGTVKLNAGQTLVELHNHLTAQEFLTSYPQTVHQLTLDLLEEGFSLQSEDSKPVPQTPKVDDENAKKNLGKLLKLIDQILAKLAKSETQAVLNNALKAKAAENLIDQQNSILFAAQQSVGSLEGRLQHRRNDILAYTNDMAHLKEQLLQKQTEEKDLKAACNQEKDSNKIRVKDWSEQLSIIVKIIELMSKNVAPVKEYVENRTK